MAKGKKNTKATKKKEFFLLRWIKGISEFFRGVNVELKKLHGPLKMNL